jgi:hypothetical protein
MSHEIVPPDPAGMIGSLSALGYSLEAAIADLVDNSIDAGATEIDVHFHWAGPTSHVSVVDNGRGMSESALITAMALGKKGATAERKIDELGRFGMGLKTASFSQTTRLAVWSCASGQVPAVRVWDLPEVVNSGEWRLLTEAAPHDQDLLEDYSERLSSGTVVLWAGLHKIVHDGDDMEVDEAHGQFLGMVERVDRHLGMTFARFLKSGQRSNFSKGPRIALSVNGAPVRPWDPFLTSNPSTLPEQEQWLPVGDAAVRVIPYVLPPKRRLTEDEYEQGGGPRGWLDQQGFYVYRNDRLILAGDWLQLPGFRKDEKHILARISVDLPSSLDQLWSIDVKKASALPPLPLRQALSRVGKVTRERARNVLTHIGNTTAVTKSDELSFVWKAEKRNGELRVRLNWSHPLVAETLRTAGDSKRDVRALLRFIEETVPVGALRVMYDQDVDRDHTPFSGVATDEVLRVAELLLASYIRSGLTPQQATDRLKNTPPMNEYPDLLRHMGIQGPES